MNADVPRFGWRLVDVHDQPGDPFLCERCRTIRTKHVHVVAHGDHALAVCRGCMLKLTASEERHRRRVELMGREWRASAKGEPYIEEGGCGIGIFQRPGSTNWRPYVRRGEKYTHNNAVGSFEDQEAAMAEAIDLFLRLDDEG